jgi:hypothetical protein
MHPTSHTIQIPPARLDELAGMLGHLLATPASQRVPARFLARIAGKLSFLCGAVSLLKVAVWSMYTALQPIFRDKDRWNARVMVPEEVRQDAQWLRRNLRRLRGDPIRRSERLLEIVSDASDTGWGSVVAETGASAGGIWTAEQRATPIHVREMLAIVLGLARFEPLLDGRQVLLRTDNQVVLSYLRRRDGLASPELRSLVRAMLRILLRNRARLVAAEWLSSSANALADHLSRAPWEVRSDWSVRTEVFEDLAHRWTRPRLDLFASPTSAKCPRFVSRAPFAQAAFHDAFSRSWTGEAVWVAPSVGLIPRCVQYLAEQWGRGLDAIVVVPGGETAWWWRWLMEHSVAFRRLGRVQDVVETTSHTELDGCSAWTLQAFRIRA